MFDRERAVQVDFQETDLLALAVQVFDSLTDHTRGGTHRDDDAVGVRRAIVIEQTVVAAGHLVDLVHVVFHDARNCLIERVRGLPRLEVDVGIHDGTAHDRALRIQAALAERVERLLVDEALQFFVIDDVDLLDLVGRPKAVKEVYERDPALDRREMGDCREVHVFLDGVGAEHRHAGLTAGHDVRVLAEDRERVRADGSRADVQDARLELSREAVERRDHQEESL